MLLTESNKNVLLTGNNSASHHKGNSSVQKSQSAADIEGVEPDALITTTKNGGYASKSMMNVTNATGTSTRDVYKTNRPATHRHVKNGDKTVEMINRSIDKQEIANESPATSSNVDDYVISSKATESFNMENIMESKAEELVTPDEVPVAVNAPSTDLIFTETGNTEYHKTNVKFTDDQGQYGVLAADLTGHYEDADDANFQDESDEHIDAQKIIARISSGYKTQQEMIDDVISKGKANRIEKDDLATEEQIGYGQFGAVFKAMWEGNVVVVKQLAEDEEIADNEQLLKKKAARLKEMEAEIVLAASLPNHHNLVTIYGYCASPFGVVMSYMPGDSVLKYVYRKFKADTDPIPTYGELLIILTKAAAGLNHLHHNGLVHRDIACRNILLGKIGKGGVVQSTEVKISDFGLTRQLKHKEDESVQKTQSNIGPLKWMAPESIRSKIYSKKSDVYMFGITMHEMFYGQEPYHGMSGVNIATNVLFHNVRPKIRKSTESEREYLMPEGYYELMKKCWDKNSKKRPNFDTIMKILNVVGDKQKNNRVP